MPDRFRLAHRPSSTLSEPKAPPHAQEQIRQQSRDTRVINMDLPTSLGAYERWKPEAPLRIPAATMCLGFAVHALRHRFPTLLQETVPGLLAPDGSLHLLRGEPDVLYATNMGFRAALLATPGGAGRRALIVSLVARASVVMTHGGTHALLFEPSRKLRLAPVLFRKADVDWCTRRLGWPETVVAERVLAVATTLRRGLGSGDAPSPSTAVSSRCFRREALAVFARPAGACGACGSTKALLPCPDCGRAGHCNAACRRADLGHSGCCRDLIMADHERPQPEQVEAALADVTEQGSRGAGSFGSPIVGE